MDYKKIYINPKVIIIDIETFIMGTSGSVQKTTATSTNIAEPKVQQSVQTKITYNVVGENINIYIPTANGGRKIQEKAVIVPGGDRCIIYDSYIYSMKQFVQNATDIQYYVEKMQQALDYKNRNLSTRDIILKVASKHISEHNRIIDGDLSMIISAVSKITEQDLNTNMEWAGMDIVLEKYKEKVFFTRFVPGKDPTLIPASEF